MTDENRVLSTNKGLSSDDKRKVNSVSQGRTIVAEVREMLRRGCVRENIQNVKRSIKTKSENAWY